MEPKPGSSHQTDKVELYEVREHVPYQPEVTHAPTTYDDDDSISSSAWRSAWLGMCQLLNLLNHMQVAIIVFCIWHFALTSTPNGAISNLQLHIVFAGTGYQLFLMEAVLTLHQHSAWASHLSSDSRRVLHGCLQLGGSLFVIAGTFLALAEVEMKISTAHGITGVIALAFTLLSFVSGVMALFSSKLRLILQSQPAKVFHVSVGMFALAMGLISNAMGFNMDYFTSSTGNLGTALIVFTGLTLAYAMVQPLTSLVSTTKKML